VDFDTDAGLEKFGEDLAALIARENAAKDKLKTVQTSYKPCEGQWKPDQAEETKNLVRVPASVGWVALAKPAVRRHSARKRALCHDRGEFPGEFPRLSLRARSL